MQIITDPGTYLYIISARCSVGLDKGTAPVATFMLFTSVTGALFAIPLLAATKLLLLWDLLGGDMCTLGLCLGGVGVPIRC